MSKMEQKAGLGPYVKNHSCHNFDNHDIPATDITHLSGHKNLQSVTNYSVVPEKQQIKMSHTLSELSARKAHDVEKSNLSQVSERSTTMHVHSSFS